MKLEMSELADSLQLPVYTVERWIRQGRIPVRKNGSTCVFKVSLLEEWAGKHDISFHLSGGGKTSKDHVSEDEAISLVAAMSRGGVFYDMSGNHVEDVLSRAVEVIPGFLGEERGLLLEKLLEREKLTSTGIGKGVAIPHPRSPLPGKDRRAMISTFFLKNPIDFQSIDEKPVSVMFVIVCPSVKTHLHLLSRISFCLRDDSFIRCLMTSPSEETLYKTLETFESRLD